MIEKTLRDAIGLNFDSIGRKGVEAVISRHMRKAGISNEKDFHALLTTSGKHFDELTEELLVPETWFFRYQESFAFLAKHVKELRAKPQDTIRVLCIPCSSGEEPYSIAITLVETGVSADHFLIDACDVSGSCLTQATHGIYGTNSFRGGIPPHILDRFFKSDDGRYEVLPELKKKVSFHKCSVLDPLFPAGRQPYAIIFCRNLLIYFPPEEQAKVIRILSSLLVDDGILFLGHAESAVLDRKEFASVNHPSSFAFRKIAHHLPPSPPAPKKECGNVATPPPPHGKSARSSDMRKSAKKNEEKIASTPASAAAQHTALLAEASASADRGDLQAAEVLCRRYLAHDKLNPAAYFLLGVVSLSEGRLQSAEDAFGKALYLQPDHYEALVNLSLLKERQGDKAEAMKIRERAERAASSSS